MSAQDLIKFDGTPGVAARINYNVPMPGSHTGRRLTRLSFKDVDDPDKFWTDAARNAGNDWSDSTGIESDSSDSPNYKLADPSGFFNRWFHSVPDDLPDESDLTVPELESRFVQQAHESDISTTLKMRDWLLGGEIFKSTSTPTKVADRLESPAAKETSFETLISTKVQRSMLNLDKGQIQIPLTNYAGELVMRTVDLSAAADPAFCIIHVYGISSFLKDYGVGRTVKVFTLLPGESTTISMKTWRSSTTSVKEASSIVDTHEESAISSFTEAVQSETTDKSTRENTTNWYVDAEVDASWGWGSAEVSGGASGETHSTSEEFARSLDETVSEHAAEASSKRETTVTSSSEYTEETGTETVIERSIKNINVGRVLNFVFRELNQEYVTKVHLKDIRIGFGNGRDNSWREVPLSGLHSLVTEMVDTAHVDETCQKILAQCTYAFDVDDTRFPLLDKVEFDGVALKSVVAEPTAGEALEAPSANRYYRFRRGKLSPSDDDSTKVDGVVLRERTNVLRTDSVIVEALLGEAQALDSYTEGLQLQGIREKELENDLLQALRDRNRAAVTFANNKDDNAANILATAYPIAADSENDSDGG